MKKYSRTLGWIGVIGLAFGFASAYDSKLNERRLLMSIGFSAIGTFFAVLHIAAVKS